jgi:hypothetical protein
MFCAPRRQFSALCIGSRHFELPEKNVVELPYLVGHRSVSRARGRWQAGGVGAHPRHGRQVQDQEITDRPPRGVLSTEDEHTAAHQRSLQPF